MNFEQGILKSELLLRKSFKIRHSTGFSHPPNPVWLATFAAFVLSAGALTADDFPARDEILSAMKEASAFYQENLAVEGGYASSWKKDLSLGYSEHRESATLISIQPHGTTTVGLRMLRAFEVTGDPLFLAGAKGAVSALVTTQLSSGGWEADVDFESKFLRGRHWRTDLEKGDSDPGKRRNASTLDDHKTTSALLLLLEYVNADEVNPSDEVKQALEFGIDGLLGAQFSNGGWPQRFDGPADPDVPVVKASIVENWLREWPDENYTRFVTLNDGNLGNVMDFLLRAHELTGESRFLAAAVRLGDFFLLAQLPESQPAWAQQYDEQMRPVWARKFEPPAVSSGESYDAAETLAKIWQETGEDRYRDAALKALAWIEKSQLPNGEWARFYELGTNRPLYCEADTYALTYDDSNLPKHYGFKIDSGLGNKVERLKALFELSPEEAREKQQAPQWQATWEKRAKGLRGKVKQAMESREPEGYWIDDGKIDAGSFVKHFGVLTDYVEALDESKKPD